MKIKFILSFCISFLLVSLFSRCTKDESVPLNQFIITSEDVKLTGNKAIFKVYYKTNNCNFNQIVLYISTNKSMSNAKACQCEWEFWDNNGIYFTSEANNLEELTTYYYYYQVSNSVNHFNTTVKQFQSGGYSIPTVTTVSSTNISYTSVTLNGRVDDGGGLLVTERGFVYSKNDNNPTINSGTRLTCGSGTGSFSKQLSGLLRGTTYYFRAYAKNSKGTAYGAVKSFKTSS